MSLSFQPWFPLSKTRDIPVSPDWVITAVDPINQIEQMYTDSLLKKKDDADTSDETADSGSGDNPLFFKNNSNPIISRIDDVGSEIGEPDCRLTKPYEIVEGELVFGCQTYGPTTIYDSFGFHTDNANPNDTLLKKYKEKTSVMRFYTNVQMVGDQILVRGYENGQRYTTVRSFTQHSLYHLRRIVNTRH